MSQFKKIRPAVPPPPPEEAVLDLVRRYARLGVGPPATMHIAQRLRLDRTKLNRVIRDLESAGRIEIISYGRQRSIKLVESS